MQFELSVTVTVYRPVSYTHLDVYKRQGEDPTGVKYKISDEIPADLKDGVMKKRAELIELVAENDDVLLEKFLAGAEINNEELKAALRRVTIAYKLVPVYAGTSLRNKGVQPVLDAVVDYLPSPEDLKEVIGINPDTKEEEKRQLTNDEDLTAIAFKIQLDPHVGKLTYARVYSGTLQSGSYVYNVDVYKRQV